LGESQFEARVGRKFMRPHLNQKLSVVMCPSLQAMKEAYIRRIKASGQPRPKTLVRLHLNGKILDVPVIPVIVVS
jgi:hypothetical protein